MIGTENGCRRVGRAAWWAAAVAAMGLAWPAEAGAQYFGRNKVQYDVFEWRVARSDRFDIHFYEGQAPEAVRAASRMADRWYTRLSRLLRHEFSRKPLILYADHPDFQQTNVIGGFIGEGTGGVTEGLRSRVVLPFTGSLADFDHVLGHEIVHVFQYDIEGSTDVAGGAGLGRLPLFLVEGMAEYLSVGREDTHTAMWLRDAALRADLPTIEDLMTDARFFPYRYGQALWAYIAGVYGDTIVGPLFRAAVAEGWDRALARVLGTSEDLLSQRWITAIRETYLPAMSGRSSPGEAGRLALADEDDDDMNVSPSLSPDGRYFAFFSSRGIFTIDLYVADARTGEVIRRLAGPRESPHFDDLSFINSSGAWSPDGRRFAFTVLAEGDNQLAILDVSTGDIVRQYGVEGVGAIMNPAWSPDGRRIAFAGMRGGLSNLYVLDVEAGRVQQLTDDAYAALHPTWSPDGRTVAFVTDRGPGTDLERLTFSPMRLALIDVETAATRLLPVFEGVRHINPQFSPDGTSLYFVADRGGFSDVYRLVLETGEVFQVTNLATGVSGITALSPALTVAARTGEVMVSVFENGRYRLVMLPPEGLGGTLVARVTAGGAADGAGAAPRRPQGDGEVAGILPPTGARGQVERYLDDPATGLPAASRELPIEPYRRSLGLLAIGPPTLGVTTDAYGTAVGGGASVVFSDMLGDRLLGVGLYGGGSLQDIGGEVVYQNLRRRWNWAVGLGRTPYLTGRTTIRDTTVTEDGNVRPALIVGQTLERVFQDQASGALRYPFSTTLRLEFSAGYTRVGFSREIEELLVIGNLVVDQRIRELDAPSSLHLFETAGALVGDDSYHGFTSPVAGRRFRIEASPIFGTLNYYGLLGDYRHYFFLEPFTIATRAFTYGRYGSGGEDPRQPPLFLGYGTLVRGYAPESFELRECTFAEGGVGCPAFDRLIGSRIAVANLEFRIPLLGTEQFGLFTFPFLPTEISPFFDAGVAWNRDEGPELTFERRSTDRVPVFSTGLSARFNLFGYVVAELYYAYPFQRPDRGALWGFQFAPGW